MVESSLDQTAVLPAELDQNIESSRVELISMLSETETQQLLYDIPASYQTTLVNLLMIALVETIGEWLDRDWIYFGVVDSGRTGYPMAANMNLSRTVGWLAFSRSYVLKRSGTDSIHEQIRSLDAQIKKVPNQGIGYNLLIRLGDESLETVHKLRQQDKDCECRLSFNYLGRMENEIANIRMAPENPGDRSRPDEKRFSLLDFICFIRQGRLHLQWVYSNRVFQQARLESIAANYSAFLKKMIEQAQLKES